MSRKDFARWLSVSFFNRSSGARIRVLRWIAGVGCLLAAALLVSPGPGGGWAQHKVHGEMKGGKALDHAKKLGKLAPRDPRADKEQAEWQKALRNLGDQVSALEVKVITGHLTSSGRGVDGILAVPRMLRAATKWVSPPDKLVGGVILTDYREGLEVRRANDKQDQVCARQIYFNGTKGDATLEFEIWNNRARKWERLWRRTVPSHALGWECYTQLFPATYKFREGPAFGYRFRWRMTAGKASSVSTITYYPLQSGPPPAL